MLCLSKVINFMFFNKTEFYMHDIQSIFTERRWEIVRRRCMFFRLFEHQRTLHLLVQFCSQSGVYLCMFLRFQNRKFTYFDCHYKMIRWDIRFFVPEFSKVWLNPILVSDMFHQRQSHNAEEKELERKLSNDVYFWLRVQ